MNHLTRDVLTVTQSFMEGNATQEAVANSFIETFGVDFDYVLSKDAANDLFRGKRLYKMDIVEYYIDESNKEYLVSDVERLVLSRVFWKPAYAKALLSIIKNAELIPEEYEIKVTELVKEERYAEAVGEIFLLAIRCDAMQKKMKRSA